MEMERTNRKVYRGEVVSDKNDKTIIVEVKTSRSHPMYIKKIKHSKRLTAQDDLNEAKIGDIVEIMETRPLSATKRFRLIKVIEKAVVL